MGGLHEKNAPARTRRPSSAPTRPKDRQHLDDLLDEALDETFPASDAIQLTSDRE
jgi:hypothetical protein